jgi:flagellar basal-body rod modification protein FlgD
MDTTITTPSTSVNVSTQAAAGSNGMAGITGNDFMSILVKQLQMQDPFKPMTNEEMIQQLSTIRELEMNTRMSGKLEQLTDQQRFGSAAALIGKKVTGKVSDGNGNEFATEGVVTGIRFTDKGDVMLELDSGQSLPLAALQTIQDPQGKQVAVAPTTVPAIAATVNTTSASTAKSSILQRMLNGQ